MQPALRAFRPETLVHVAWAGVSGGDRNDLRQIANIAATASLLEEAIAAGATSFVGFGSQAEYGRQGRKTDEKAPTEPTTLYGHSKLATCRVTEAMCRLREVRHAWLRVFSVYGPRDNAHWLIPSLIAKLQAGQVVDLTACEQIWDFLYIDDAAEAATAVVESPSASGVFNLGSGDGISIARRGVSPARHRKARRRTGFWAYPLSAGPGDASGSRHSASAWRDGMEPRRGTEGRVGDNRPLVYTVRDMNRVTQTSNIVTAFRHDETT